MSSARKRGAHYEAREKLRRFTRRLRRDDDMTRLADKITDAARDVGEWTPENTGRFHAYVYLLLIKHGDRSTQRPGRDA